MTDMYFTDDNESLFSQALMSSVLQRHLDYIKVEVDKIPEERFRDLSDEEVVAQLKPELGIQPLVFHKDQQEILEQGETELDSLPIPLSSREGMKVASSESEARTPTAGSLCHDSDDKKTVRKIYHRLQNEGFVPWLDEEDLLAGQKWRTEIPRVVRRSDAVVVCLSPRAVDKSGFVQKEIRVALDAFDEKPEGSIYLLPVQLEECRIPERLADFHTIGLTGESGFTKLLKALRAREKQLE